jgi:hypothetical protein
MKSFEEISKELNTSPIRIKYIYWNAIKKIRHKLREDKELKKYLEDILEDIKLRENNTPHVNFLSSILYDSYGKEKL